MKTTPNKLEFLNVLDPAWSIWEMYNGQQMRTYIFLYEGLKGL